MDPSTTVGLVRPGVPPPVWIVARLHALEWILLGDTAYVTLLPLAGFAPRRQRRRLPPEMRFAVVTPAHNERVVIDNPVGCCLAMDYPRRLFHVHVIADNCSDDTAALARGHGARVMERTSSRRRGKGHALADAFQRLLATQRYEAVVIFDADNLVDPLCDKRPLRPVRFLILYRLFVYSWIPLTWGGVLRARNREWGHTAHTRAIAYADLVGGKGAG